MLDPRLEIQKLTDITSRICLLLALLIITAMTGLIVSQALPLENLLFLELFLSMTLFLVALYWRSKTQNFDNQSRSLDALKTDSALFNLIRPVALDRPSRLTWARLEVIMPNVLFYTAMLTIVGIITAIMNYSISELIVLF